MGKGCNWRISSAIWRRADGWTMQIWRKKLIMAPTSIASVCFFFIIFKLYILFDRQSMSFSAEKREAQDQMSNLTMQAISFWYGAGHWSSFPGSSHESSSRYWDSAGKPILVHMSSADPIVPLQCNRSRRICRLLFHPQNPFHSKYLCVN